MGELFAYPRLNGQEMDRVPATDAELASYGLGSGDLLFARQSLVAAGAGKCAIVLAAPEPTTFESHLIRVRLDPSKGDPRYFYYYLMSPHGKGRIQSLVMQVAAAGIRGSELALLHLPVPPIEIQRRVASILAAYDDLIENNTRRIAILEEMARSLYREWFVEFRFPGHEDVEMVDSPFGPVPHAWPIERLSDLVTTQYGYTESASDNPVGPKFLRGMDINKNSYIEWENVPYCPISDDRMSRYQVSRGDIVVIRMADP
ncbi:MAG: restriction endonuclease subunit S, partial [Chloroflexi bacterium]|nr:restriction endonuclease subunit S [Chloroflexota bacterium]